MTLETVSAHGCHGGTQSFHRHTSVSTGVAMRFSVFTPPGEGPHPILWCLAGLTCTEENFPTKAGAQARAAKLGLTLVAPDTSPRGEGVADDPAFDGFGHRRAAVELVRKGAAGREHGHGDVDNEGPQARGHGWAPI